MSLLTSWAERHTMALFFTLAYLLSWWPGLIAAGGLSPVGPLLAAIIVLWLVGGKPALKAWWNQAARWRGSPKWYVLAILLPFAINFAAAALTVLFGAPFPEAEKIARWPELFIIFPLYLVAFGPLGEEPGWRGFAMPRFQRRHSALVASLTLGLFVAVWHLPLVMSGQQHAIILVAVVASQVMYTWLANQVEGRVLIVIIAHAAQGGLGGEYFGTMFTGDDALLETSFLVAIQSLVAIGIVLFTPLRVVKLVHTIAWAFFVACIVATPYFAWTGRFDVAFLLNGVVFVESLIIALNKWRCPLTDVAERYTSDRHANFDIYLPLWLARYNKEIFGPLFGAGLLFTVARWLGWLG